MKFSLSSSTSLRTALHFLIILCFCCAGVVSAQNLQADQTAVTFSAEPGHVAPSTFVTVTSTGGPISGLSISATTASGGTWLFLNPTNAASTPVTIFAIAYAYTLSAGTYQATIKVTSTSPARELTIPVTFMVGGGGGPTTTLTASPTTLSFAGQAGGSAPGAKQISVTSSPTGANFTASASTTDGNNWLQVSPASGTAPATVNVSVNTGGLSAGNYSGTVTLTPTGGSAVTVSVSLTLSSSSGLSVSTTSLNFSHVIGASPPGTKTFEVTATGSNALSFTTSATMTDGSGWLSAAPASGTTPQTVTVSVSPTGLAAGVYRGKVAVTPQGTAGGAIDVSVTLTVTTSGTAGIQVDPKTLSFTGQVGGLSPASQQINVSSNPSGVTFTASAETASGGSWLQISPATSTAPAALTVGVKTTGMSAGTYSGTITLTPSSGAPVTVPVTLTLTSGPVLSVGVTGLQFFYTTGAKLPAPQKFNITGASVNFKVATSTDVTGWLAASPVEGNIPGTVTVTVSPVGLASGVYQGKVTVSAPTVGNTSIDVPVTLVVSSGPLLVVTAPPLSFVYQPGGSAPESKTITVESSAQILPVTTTIVTTDGNRWLSVSPDATTTTPQNLIISVNPGTLAPGTYSGVVSIMSAAASNSPILLPVVLTVANSYLVPSVPTVTFNYQIGGVNQVLTQALTVVSSGGDPTSGSATVATANCPSGWLQVSPTTFTTPATVNVTFNPAGLSTAQSCAGVVVLTANGKQAVVSVGANVTSTLQVNITPLSLRLYAPSRGQPATQTVEVSTTDNSAAQFTAAPSTSGGGSWLSVARQDGATKSVLTVSANPASLGVGVYSGAVRFSSSTTPSGLLIPVVFVVTPATVASANAASLVFTQSVRGTPPPAQKLEVSTTDGAFAYNASVVPGMPASDYISITPLAGTTPASLSVSVLPNSLAAGTYDTAVAVGIPVADTKPLTVPVRIMVSGIPNGASITASPTAAAFSVVQGATAALTQKITVTSTVSPVNLGAAVGPDTKWLSVTPDSSTTPGTFTISANPSGLAADRYKGVVTLTSAGVGSITIPVQLDVTAVPINYPKISAVSNAASGVRTAISPGEIVTITGSAIGPASSATSKLNAAGNIDTTLSGTQVFFEDFPAPLLYVSATQINAIVPYEVAGMPTARVKVVSQGLSSDPYTIQVGTTAPGIFTTTENGRGQGAILNANNSVNGLTWPATPARRGSIVQVFGTGEGVVDPANITGSITQGLHLPLADVTATVGGIPAEVVFAGAAPQAVSGLFQVNVRIPDKALAGDVPITITIGGVSTQTGVTVAVSWL